LLVSLASIISALLNIPLELLDQDVRQLLVDSVDVIASDLPATFRGSFTCEWFKTDQSRDSLFIVQKKGAESKQVSEVLIADASVFNNQKELKDFIMGIKKWKIEQHI